MTTDQQIDTAILAAITEAGGDDLHAWAAIRQQVPGNHNRKTERLIALWHSGRVWLIKVAGRNYVSLGDAYDEQAAANRARTPRCL
ncbi:MAG: hypothetical protein EKK34_22055 [Mycobacterium sp.]|nr:MAG: hypothetical protein EKK34_22055 [Mycobacterium sp.]